MSRLRGCAAAVEQFHSETDAIRGMPEPRWARATVFVLGGSLLRGGRPDVRHPRRSVIVSAGGKIVSSGRAERLSGARSVDHQERSMSAKARRWRSGQLLATLDPTFAAADVKQLSQQIASLETQIARQEAVLAGRAPAFRGRPDPGLCALC